MSSADFPVHQENDEVALGRILRVVAASVAVGAAGVLAAWALLRASGPHARSVTPTARARAEIAEVEQTPIDDARRGLDLREAHRRELARWGRVDHDAGAASLSISRAMDMVIEAGR